MTPESNPVDLANALAAEPTQETPKNPQIGEVKNYSRAVKIARHLFGPFARVTPAGRPPEVRLHPLGTRFAGASYREALQNALDYVIKFSNENEGKNPPGVMQARAANVVDRERQKLLGELVNAVDAGQRNRTITGLLQLMPHEVFEARRLSRGSQEGPVDAREAMARQLSGLISVSASRQPQKGNG